MWSIVPVGALVFAAVAALAVAPIRRPRRLARLSWSLTLAPAELPLHFAVVAVASTAPSVVAGDVTSARDRIGLALTIATIAAFGVVLRRGLRARQVLDAALAEGLGAGGARPRRRRPWGRILFVPWPFRPRDVELVRAVRYGPDAGHLLDVYRHRSRPESAPTLIHFHGGGFTTGRRSWEARPLLHHLARRGWTCISADYHLSPSPGDGFPRHLVDAKRVVAWARTEGRCFGIDPERVAVAGSSAGAHLTTMLALTAGDPAFQPGFEDTDTSITAGIGLYGYYGRLDDGARPTSPVDHADGSAPPFLVIHGTNDTYTPIEGARALVAAMRGRSPNPVVFAELPGAQHSFDVFHSVRFEAVVDAIEGFAGWALQRTPTGRVARD